MFSAASGALTTRGCFGASGVTSGFATELIYEDILELALDIRLEAEDILELRLALDIRLEVLMALLLCWSSHAVEVMEVSMSD